MLQDSMSHAREDMDARNLREQQVEADRVLDALQVALAADGDTLLSTEERSTLQAAMQKVRKLAVGNDEKALKTGIKELNANSTEFASRRMNASIQQALSGHQLEDFE
jgi:molecular chaperone HscA